MGHSSMPGNGLVKIDNSHDGLDSPLKVSQEEVIEKPVEEKPTPTPKPKRVRPSRAKPPFDPEKFKNELVQQLKEEMKKEITVKDAYYRAKEEKNIATREKLKSLASKIL